MFSGWTTIGVSSLGLLLTGSAGEPLQIRGTRFLCSSSHSTMTVKALKRICLTRNNKLEKFAVLTTCRPTPGECKFWLHLVLPLDNHVMLSFHFLTLRVDMYKWQEIKLFNLVCKNNIWSNPRFRVRIWLLTFCPSVDYMCTNVGADSSSCFPFRVWTGRCDWTPTPRRRLYSRRG